MKRTFRYRPDGTSYEVTKSPPVPRVYFSGLKPALDESGREISQRELRRLNAEGKNLHIEEARNIAMDAHNEHERQAKLEKAERKAAIVDAVNGHGL